MALLTVIGSLIMALAVVTIGSIAFIRRHRDRIHGSGTLGNALQEIEGLFVESKSHVLKADRAEEAEEESGSGDPPEKS